MLASSAACALAAFSAPTVASAQPAAAQSSTLEEVVVTARKREESLQQVPVAVTSASGAQLEKQGVRTPLDLGKFVPSLTVAPSASQNSAAVFSLRGQTPGDILLTISQPVGVYVDSGNVPHPAGLLSSFFDIQRVEVLKGPQGTLYGRNTTGGALNIITRGADYSGVHGFVGAEAGDYSDWKLNGAVNLPIIEDKLAVRVAFQHWNRDGYGKSSTTGQDLGGDHNDNIGRLSIRFDPTSSLTSTTKLEYARSNQNGYLITLHQAASSPMLEAGLETRCGSFANLPALAACGAAALRPFTNTGDIFTNSSEGLWSDRTSATHAVEDFTWSFADLRLRSVTAYHRVNESQALDLDSSPFQILETRQLLIAPFARNPNIKPPDIEYHAWTQEFNLSGTFLERLDWLVGAFGSWEHGRGGNHSEVLTAVAGGRESATSTSEGETTDTWALFTQNDLHLSERVSLTFGLRYTEERESNAARQYTWDGGTGTIICTSGGARVPSTGLALCPMVASSLKSSGTSYLLSGNFQITPDTLLYVKTARGFRGGALQFRAPDLPGVSPEIATDYEIGVKSDFFDRRLRANLAAYHTNYENKQETVIINSPAGVPTTVLQNAASAQINGFEAELNAVPTEGLSLYGTLTWLKGEYGDYKNPLTGDGTLLFASIPACAARPANLPPECIAHGIKFQDPEWRYSLGARYEHPVGPGSLSGQLDWSWVSRIQDNVLNLSQGFGATGVALQHEFREPVGLLNGRIEYRLPDQQVTVALWSTNLLDKHYQTAGLISPALGIATGTTQEPRMWGVTIRKAFGQE